MVALCIVISACQAEKQDEHEIPFNFSLYESDFGYKIAVPLGYTYSEMAPSGDHYYFGYPDGNDLGLNSIDIYPKQPKCTSGTMGSSQIQALKNANGYAGWGRVDVWDNIDKEGYEWPENWKQIVCKKEGIPPPAEMYTLCSRKDRKTIIACISQERDNPELAKQIFESFRWTDGEGAGGAE